MSNWNGWDTFQEKNPPPISHNRLTVISKNYLVWSIFFLNIKFHREREPPTHDTIICPICVTIFFERGVFRIPVGNCLPKIKTTGLHRDLFSSNAHLPEHSGEDDYYISSPESFRAESNSIEINSSNEEAPDEEIYYIGNKKVLKGTFDNLRKIKMDKIPLDIDGKKLFQVTSHTQEQSCWTSSKIGDSRTT